MKKLNIALMAGGDSSEREVSLRSAAQVCDALDRAKYDVYLIDVHGRDWTWSGGGTAVAVDRNDFSVATPAGRTVFDYALVLIHGTPGEDGKLQGYFEMMGVPFSSCDMVSSVLTFDKQACKRAVADAGVTLARGVLLRRGERVAPDSLVARLGLPMFVKPNASGSSFGVTKVNDTGEIPAALEAAFAESDAVLCEEMVRGREIACGLLLAPGREIVLPLTEIVSKKEFFDYEAKYTPGFSDEITPAEIDPAAAAEIKEMAARAYRACGCRGIVRVDFILRGDGVPVMIEINSVPGMSAGSIVPKQAAAAGITIGELFDIVIETTLK